MKHLKKSRRAAMEAEAYQRVLDIAAEADAAEGIRQGLEDKKRGHIQAARDVFDEIRAEHDIPR